MATPPVPNNPSPAGDSGGRAPATLAELQHHETRFLRALKLIVDSGRAKSTDDLIRYSEQDHQVEAASYLRTLVPEKLPVDLAYDALSVHIRLVAHKRNSQLMVDCQGRRVGVILPIPPHLIDAFTSLTSVTFLLPDGHPLPPHLRERATDCRIGSRAAREIAGSLEVIVFEAFEGDQEYFADAGTLDIIDPRIVSAETKLIAHLRPHRNPDDTRLNLASRTLHIL